MTGAEHYVEAETLVAWSARLRRHAMTAATCRYAACDGETHYSGERDPETGEDVELGPCPRWTPAPEPQPTEPKADAA